MFKLDLKKKYAYRIQNPGAERVNAKKSIYFAQKMNTCMNFMHPPKTVQIW